MASPKDILQQYWGYEAFRPPQEEIINTILQQKDVVAVLPTGSGKSVIYQVAGLYLGGLTLVISPLIALMEDQHKALLARGIKSIALTGGISYSDLQRLLDNAQYGQTRFLFMSPERLQDNFVQKRLSQIPVKLIAIDEAHCISEWGHDFRPSYTQLHILKNLLPQTPVLALTATAKNRVIKDIAQQLQLKQSAVFKSSISRDNIAYKVIQTEQQLNTLAHLLQPNQTAIVYVKTRKKTYQYAQYMAQKGFKTAYFHGGMALEDKQQALNDWLQNRTQVMFATTAFGMGINKPDVRQVFHLDLPASLENYVQESGRAGRDEQMSEAVILVAPHDLKYFEANYLNQLPDLDFIQRVYRSLFNHFSIAEHQGEGFEANLNFVAFCKTFQLDLVKTLQAFQILESEGILKFKQTRQYYDTVKVIGDPMAIRQYIKRQGIGASVLDHLIRSHTDIFYIDTKIYLKQIAQDLELSIPDLKDLLTNLSKREFVTYQPAGEIFKIRFLEPRNQHLLQKHSHSIDQRLTLKREQLKEVYRYVTQNKLCRHQFLGRYFEETDAPRCGICDVCLSKKTPLSDQETAAKILELLADNCLPAITLKGYFNHDITKHLNKLVELNKIHFKHFKYCLTKNHKDV